MNRRIVAGLAAASVSAVALPARAQAQEQAVITGRVTNAASGQGVSGVTVAIPELGVGTLTNDVGSYTLTVPAARVRGQSVGLQVRFIGYKQQRRALTLAGGRQTQNFTLEADANRLTEVVVTGLSVATERSKVPFAVQRVTAEQTPVPGVNALAQIQGKVPGANIVATSGRPGSSPEVLLRGPKSFNAQGRSQEPLYIVDGVILSNNTAFGPLADINPQDIESVEVVSGTAAASLYGSQAANGVIQIVTKRGSNASNGVRFSVRSEYGINDIEREIAIAQRHALLMDPTQTRFCVSNGLSGTATNTAAPQARSCARTVDWLQETLRINDQSQDFTLGSVTIPIDPNNLLQAVDARRLFQTTPWPGANYNAVQDLARPKPLAINNIDMTGRFGSTDVFAAINNTNQGGAIAYLDGSNRTSLRVNAGQGVGTTLRFEANAYFARTSQDGFNQDGGNGNAFFALTRTPPIVDLTRLDSQGRVLVRTNLQASGTQNANALQQLQNIERRDNNNRFVGSVSGRYTPLSWLNADVQVGLDNQDSEGRLFTNRGFRTTTASPTANNGSVFNYAQGARSINGSAGITLPNLTPFKGLSVSPSLRTLYLQRDFNSRNVSGNQLYVSNVETFTNALQSSLSAGASRASERQLSYIGGLRFEYNDRYILDGSLRRDGNSTFGVDERWQTYGRIAGAWVVSNEGFFKPIEDKVNLFKLSANYGTSGLSPSFSAQYETYTIGAGGALNPAVLGNPRLRPQVDVGYELNAEVGFLRDFNFQATYAQSNTRDQIDIVNLPLASRFPQQWQNIGSLRNSTVELTLGFPVLKTRRINWTGRANYASTVTTVSKLNVPAYTRGGTGQAQNDIFFIREGERFSTFYGQRFATKCEELPANVRNVCGGAGSQYQKNSDGYVVWTGGRGVDEGYTGNLWNTSLPGSSPVAPYKDVPFFAWGHPIVLRDTTSGNPAQNLPLGQALPKFRSAITQNIVVGRFTAYGLVDAAVGQSVWNQARGWSYLDFLSADLDQANRNVGDVKPQSYYYRGAPPASGLGAGGLYNILAPNNHFTEKASYAKLREVTVNYRIGKIVRAGDWTVGVTGRNLHTWTNYKGFDPEVGSSGTAGAFGSGALTAVDFFGFPNLRTFSFTVSSRF